jgi:hypothetical protein
MKKTITFRGYSYFTSRVPPAWIRAVQLADNRICDLVCYPTILNIVRDKHREEENDEDF